MPTLKHLTCAVEWSGSNMPLRELQTTYGDGYVQTYVAVPPTPTPFSIHLRSHGYIAPGLAMYVYIDGEYQCNRFRQNLRIPDGTTTRKQTEVDFHVRQKEEMLEDGIFEGKQWRFQNLNISEYFTIAGYAILDSALKACRLAVQGLSFEFWLTDYLLSHSHGCKRSYRTSCAFQWGIRWHY